MTKIYTDLFGMTTLMNHYEMTRLTFGISALSFIANMCLKQNVIDFGSQYPKAAQEVETSFYVDDYLRGGNSQQEAIQLQGEMHALLLKGGFLLRKWSCSDPHVLESFPTDLRDSEASVILSHSDQSIKTLGIEWNALCEHFRVHVTKLPPIESMTKRSLVSDVTKTFDALGWYSPTIRGGSRIYQRGVLSITVGTRILSHAHFTH